MTRKVQSIKGQEVDFDLFEIKAQISNTPKTSDVLMRETYIDIKRRRPSRKSMAQLLADQEKNKSMVSESIKNQKETTESVEAPVQTEAKAETGTEENNKKEKTKKRVVRKK